MTEQRRRIWAIVSDIIAQSGPLPDDIETVVPLVDEVLEAPLSEDYEEARTDICEVLLHLGLHTGDE